MGCDIHMFVEYKQKEKWINGDYYRINPYKGQEDEPDFERLELHGLRNYSLFSTLAGVRDYSGKVIPVDNPRGFPNDASYEVKNENKEWGSDAHTHSFLTLKELKDYDSKNPKITYSGLLSEEQISELEKGITPEHWCQGTSAPNYQRREWSEDNITLKPLIEKLEKRCHELFKYDWEEKTNENDEDIRIIFWFDN